MKIAVTYENGEVFQHFGHTEQFKIYETNGSEVISSEVISTNGSGHSALAEFLKAKNVSVLICGGIGAGAKTALSEANIKLYGGVSGNADAKVKDFLCGTLCYNPNTECNHHEHHGDDCENHDHNCGHHCGTTK